MRLDLNVSITVSPIVVRVEMPPDPALQQLTEKVAELDAPTKAVQAAIDANTPGTNPNP